MTLPVWSWGGVVSAVSAGALLLAAFLSGAVAVKSGERRYLALSAAAFLGFVVGIVGAWAAGGGAPVWAVLAKEAAVSGYLFVLPLLTLWSWRAGPVSPRMLKGMVWFGGLAALGFIGLMPAFVAGFPGKAFLRSRDLLLAAMVLSALAALLLKAGKMREDRLLLWGLAVAGAGAALDASGVWPGMRWFGVGSIGFGVSIVSAVVWILSCRSQMLRQMERCLDRSERRFYQIADGISEAFWLSELGDGTLLYLNDAFERIWEMPVAEVFGDTESWLRRVHPEDRDYVMRAFRNPGGNDRLEYRLRFEDGREKWVSDGLYVVKDDEGRPYRLARVIEEITDRKRAEQELAFLAFYDTLTRLPNRRSFFERFEDTVVREGPENGGRMRAIVMLDLDNFKVVNDTFGHATADRVLAEVAKRIRSHLGPRDKLFRLGSDEFVAVLAGQESEDRTRETVGRMMASVSAPVAVEGFEIAVSVSAGVSFYPRDGSTREVLLRNADIALVQAKRDRNTVRVFRPQMLEEANRRMGIINRMRSALERGEFFLEFQPLVDASGRMVGAEALARWQDPVFGRVVWPSEFVGIAEETGLVVPMGQWVLRESCRSRKGWPVDPSFRLAVNISARQFRQKDFVERFFDTVKESGLAPSALECEITESSVMENPEESIRKMRRLVDEGVTFALDDFGTGYSSMGYLHKFPVRSLKIDRSFVAGLGAAEDTSPLVATMIALARGMGLRTVAEGVETPQQAERLKSLGCDWFQGFLFYRPLTAEGMLEMLRGERRRG